MKSKAYIFPNASLYRDNMATKTTKVAGVVLAIGIAGATFYYGNRIGKRVQEMHRETTIERQDVSDALGLKNNANPGVLLRLAYSRNLVVKETVAAHPNTPDMALSKLSHSEDVSVLAILAKREKVPPEVLRNIAESSFIRGYLDTILPLLLENKNTSPETLDYIAHLADIFYGTYNAKLAIASREDSLPQTLEYLSFHEYKEIREAVAGNPSTPKSVLSKLSVDEDPDVRKAAQLHLRDLLRNKEQ